MAYRIVIGNVKIECDTVEDLTAFLDKHGLPGGNSEGGGSGSPPPPVNLGAPNDQGSPAYRMLRIVHGGGTHGVPNEALVTSLRLSSGRGLGPFMRGVQRQLHNIGMTADDVVSQRRAPDGRRWHSGPRIEEAIQRLQH